MSTQEEWPKYLPNIPYSDHSPLNTLDICLPRPPTNTATDHANPHWLIYIHGGAWRDPLITSQSFTAIQSRLLSSPHAHLIAGYASLNYRLSPYPSHPTDPSNPSDPSRNAKHPDHINDVLAALLHLQETYGFEDRYILVGHSAGATLALQVAMRRFWGAQYESTFALELNVVPPVAVVGLAGIYDLPALVKYHGGEGVYRDFVANAVEVSQWASASPTAGNFGESWVEGGLVVLAHSPRDSLVEMEQPEIMRGVLEGQGWSGEGQRRVLGFELEGDHNEVWQSGEGCKVIEMALRELHPS